MANTHPERGACLPPFLQLSNFDSNAGYTASRLCAPVPTLNGTVTCCLPCPFTDWVYSDEFQKIPQAASWLNVAGMACSLSLLVTYFVLPVQKTSRHYLTVGLVTAVCLMQLGFIIPLGARPQQCHDAITPNDMYSDLTCAFSGAFLLFGGFSGIMWGFLRSLSIHLQICWQVVPGKKFFWGSIISGWGIPAIIIAVALSITGTSYRFGSTCHINHEDALQDYWGPLLAFAAISTILQFVTFGYCIKVYLRALFTDTSINSQSQVSTGLPSYNSRSGSIKTVTPGQAYRRIQKVIALQWRGTIIVLIIIINVVFLAVVFVQMDNSFNAAIHDFSKAQPWLLCLVTNGGDKNKCLDKVQQTDMTASEATLIAVLFVLSLNGIWTLLFLGRTSMLVGWRDLIRDPFRRPPMDFVSVDARRFSAISGAPSSNKHYEMIRSPSSRPPSLPNSITSLPLKSADANFIPTTTSNTIITSFKSEGLSPLPQSPRTASSIYRDSDYLSRYSEGGSTPQIPSSVLNLGGAAGGTQEVEYRSPKLSFSTPRPPSAGRAFSRESSISRPYSVRQDSLPQQGISVSEHVSRVVTSNSNPPLYSTHTASQPQLQPQRSESRGRGRTRAREGAYSPVIEWDPTSTYARGGVGTVRSDGLGRIIDKDEGF